MNASVRNWVLIAGLCPGLPAVAAEVGATLQWARVAPVSLPVSGVVQRVAAQPGQSVSRGQAVVSLDPRLFKARLELARARVALTGPARDEAQRELQRSQELYDRTVLSDHELELDRVAFARADAEHRMALAQATEAELDLEYSVGRAPFDGVVVERRVEPGQSVVSRCQAEPLLSIAEQGRLLARARIEPAQARALAPGQSVSVDTPAGRLSASVERIYAAGGAADAAQPALLLEVAVTVTPQQALFPGQQVSIELP